MKSILIIFLLLFSIVTFAQDEERPGNGQCNGHYPGDGHGSMHPCHLNDPPSVPIDNILFVSLTVLGIGILVYKRLKQL